MRARFFRLYLVLAFGVTAGIGLAPAQITQTPQMAYSYASSLICPAGHSTCSASWVIVTPYGQTAGPNDTQPTWSPDGTKIAFNRNGDIFVIAAPDGSNAVNITNTGNNQTPARSPDGTRIAFATMRDGHYELYLMNGNGQRRRYRRPEQ